jgi:hypothetical protein
MALLVICPALSAQESGTSSPASLIGDQQQDSGEIPRIAATTDPAADSVAIELSARGRGAEINPRAA